MKSHYCFSGHSHIGECNCSCSSCSSYMMNLKQEIFNKKLSDAIRNAHEELFLSCMKDKEFVDMFVVELKKDFSIKDVLPAKQTIWERFSSSIKKLLRY